MRLNPDKGIVAQIKEALKHTQGYCPCIVARTEDTKCPCKAMREEHKCHCGLYVRGDMGQACVGVGK